MLDIKTCFEGESLWQELSQAANALTENEPDPIANMANLAALLFHGLDALNWAGFYRVAGSELILGPFQGKPACIRIAKGTGVCGTAWAEGRTQRVPDVHAFPGHIACDSASRSELVVPVWYQHQVVAVIDLDSPVPDRFSLEDADGLEALAEQIASRIVSPGPAS